MMSLSVNRTVMNHFKQGKNAEGIDSHEYFIYCFYLVENIDKIQYCDQQSALLQQL